MKKVLSILLSVMLILSTMTCLMLIPATASETVADGPVNLIVNGDFNDLTLMYTAEDQANSTYPGEFFEGRPVGWRVYTSAYSNMQYYDTSRITSAPAGVYENEYKHAAWINRWQQAGQDVVLTAGKKYIVSAMVSMEPVEGTPSTAEGKVVVGDNYDYHKFTDADKAAGTVLNGGWSVSVYLDGKTGIEAPSFPTGKAWGQQVKFEAVQGNSLGFGLNKDGSEYEDAEGNKVEFFGYYAKNGFEEVKFVFDADEFAAANGLTAVDGKYNARLNIGCGTAAGSLIDDVCMYEVVDVVAEDGGYVSADTAIVNDTVTLTAKPYYGNTFKGWYKADGTLVTYNNVYTGVATEKLVAKFNNYNLVSNGDFEAADGAFDSFEVFDSKISNLQIADKPESANVGHGDKALLVSTPGYSTANYAVVKVPTTVKKNTKYIYHFSMYVPGELNTNYHVWLFAEKGFTNRWTPNANPALHSLYYNTEKADGTTNAINSYRFKGNNASNVHIQPNSRVVNNTNKWVDMYLVIDTGADTSIFEESSDEAVVWLALGYGNDSGGNDTTPNFYIDNFSLTEVAYDRSNAIEVVAGANGSVAYNEGAKKTTYEANFYDTDGGEKAMPADDWLAKDAEGNVYPTMYSNVVTNTGSYTATAAEDYTFMGWYVGDELISKNSTCELYNENVVAKFAKALYAEDGGYLKDNGDGTVTAVAYYGNTFKGWYKDGVKLSGGEYDTYTVTNGEDKFGVTAVFNNYNQMADGNFESGDPNGADFYNTLAYEKSPVSKNNKVVELPANVTNDKHGKYALWCEPKASATASDYAETQRLVRIPISVEAGKEYTLSFSYYVPEVPVKPDGTALHSEAWESTMGAKISGDYTMSRWTLYWKKESAAVPSGWCGHTETDSTFNRAGTIGRIQWAGYRADKYGLWVDVYVLFTASTTADTYFDFGLLNNCVSGFYMDNIALTEAGTANSTVVSATATAGGTVAQSEAAIMKFDHALKNGATNTDLDKYADYHVAGTTRYSQVAYRTYTATANDGYKFMGWQNAAGEIVSKNATETFQTEGTYTAVFATAPEAAEGGYLVDNGDGTITAVPYYGNTFAGWSNGETNATINADDVYGAIAQFNNYNMFIDGNFESGTDISINRNVKNQKDPTQVTSGKVFTTHTATLSVKDAPASVNAGHGNKALYVDTSTAMANSMCYVLKLPVTLEKNKEYIFHYSVYQDGDSPADVLAGRQNIAKNFKTGIQVSGMSANDYSWYRIFDKITLRYNSEAEDSTTGAPWNYCVRGGKLTSLNDDIVTGANNALNKWMDYVILVDTGADDTIFAEGEDTAVVYLTIGCGNDVNGTYDASKDGSPNFYVDNISITEVSTTENDEVAVDKTAGGKVVFENKQITGTKWYNTGLYYSSGYDASVRSSGNKDDTGKEELLNSTYQMIEDDGTVRSEYLYSKIESQAGVNTAVADKGFTFVEWQKDGETYSKDATINITTPGSYKAIFVATAMTNGFESTEETDRIADSASTTTLSWATYTTEQTNLPGYEASMGETYLAVENGADHVDISIPVVLKANERTLIHFKYIAVESTAKDPNTDWTEENQLATDDSSRADFRLTNGANVWNSYDNWVGKLTFSSKAGLAQREKTKENKDISWYTGSWFGPANQAAFGTNIIDVYYDVTANEDTVVYVSLGQWATGTFGIDNFTVTTVSDLAPTMVGATFDVKNDKDANNALYVTRVALPEFLAISKVETFMGVASQLATAGRADDFDASVENVTMASLSAYAAAGYITMPASPEAFREGDLYTTFTGATTAAKTTKFSVRSEITLTDAYGHDLGITIGTDNVYSRSINQIKRLLAKSLGANAAVYNGDIADAWQYVLNNAPAAQ